MIGKGVNEVGINGPVIDFAYCFVWFHFLFLPFSTFIYTTLTKFVLVGTCSKLHNINVSRSTLELNCVV